MESLPESAPQVDVDALRQSSHMVMVQEESTEISELVIPEDSELGEVSNNDAINRGIDREHSLVIDADRQNSDSKGEMENVPRESRRVSFGPKGGHAYSRQTSKFDQSLTISFGASSDKIFHSDFSNDNMHPKSKDFHKSLGFRTTFATKDQSHLNQEFRISKNPTQMKMERIEAFCFNHGMEIALGVLYLALNLLMAGYGAYQFSQAGGWAAPNKVLAVTLPIARAGGRLVTLNCAILLLTGCKYLWTLVRTYVAPVVPIGFPIDEVMPKYHRYVALTIIFSGCILHTIPQIVNYASRSITMDHKGMRFWTFGDGFATKQLLLTGTLLAIIFSSFFFTTLQAFRKTAAGFRWFWTFHMAGIATAYPLLLIHGTCRGHPIFLYFAILPLVLYLFDISMRRKNNYSTNVLRWRVHDDDGQQITELVLECPKNFSYTPGQYAELKFDPISTREWHPFTIASSPGDGHTSDDEVVFYIKNVGRWTGAMMDYAAAFDLSKALRPTKIFIRGPHGAPAMNYTEYKHILVIGSGVGVTPLLSIWDYLLDKGKESVIAQSRAFRDYAMSTTEYERKSKSTKIMEQSVDIFNDQAQSQRFLMDFSRSVNFFESYALSPGSLENSEYFGNKLDGEHTQVPSVSFPKKIDKIRLRCIFLALFLESMTISLSVFVLFVLGGTASICFQFGGWHLAANAVASSLALVSFLVHGIDIIVWTIIAGSIYFRLFKGWLECTIVFVNCFAFWFSIRGCMMARGQIDATVSDFNASLISICVVNTLQAIRIFHVFYMTLKVQTSHHGKEKQKEQKHKRTSIIMDGGVEFCSVDGIVINRKYSNMKFAARCILPPILQEGLSDVFSMEFYGTRENPKKKKEGEDEQITEHSLVGEMMGSAGDNITVRESIYYSQKEQEVQPHENFFCAGRPDWNRIFLKAISKAHATNEEGESVGVFFCGSPAIAHALKSEAKKVTAQHQFAMNCLDGKRCRCKLIVHSENF